MDVLVVIRVHLKEIFMRLVKFFNDKDSDTHLLIYWVVEWN